MSALDEGLLLQLDIPGRPRTKGSLRPVHIKLGGGRCRVSLTESGEYATAWKHTMIQAIKREQPSILPSVWPYTGAVEVHSFFRFERLTGTDAALQWPTRVSGEWSHGDEDKLRRNLLDALTQSGLLADDCLVVGGYNLKRFCEPGEQPGVQVMVRTARPASSLVEQIMMAPRPDWTKPVVLEMHDG